jgi:hypothetical protein
MPDANGMLGPEELKLVQQRLAQYWSPGPVLCPVTHDTNWEIMQFVMTPVAATGMGLVLGGPILPVVSIVCRSCGYTMFFSAVT